jgi:hypothetical protein
LIYADNDFDIQSFVDYLQRRGAFTPNQLATVLWRLSKFRIPHNPKDFKLTIKRNREKVQLKGLKDWQIAKIKPALTASQREFLERRNSSHQVDWGDDDE